MSSGQAFSIPVRIYIEDTDAGGIVFYANYLKFFERSRTEFIRALGYELRRGLERDINYVVHSVSLRYHKPARLDDLVHVHTRVKKVARTYLEFDQWVSDGDGQCLVNADVKVACVCLRTGRPRGFPEEFSQKLSSVLC